MRLLTILFGCLSSAANLFPQSHPHSPEARPPIVRSIHYAKFAPITLEEILQTFKEKDVKLRVEAPYDPKDLQFARMVLTNLLAEKGKPGARVNVTVTPAPPHSVSVSFTAVTR